MSKLIPPTPGRVVWYYPSQHEIDAKQIAIYDQGQPLAATVAYVFSDRLVNLSVVDQAGAQFRRTSVQLLQEDDPVPHTSEGPYATWMPYQLGQAKQAADVGTTGEAAQQAETAGKFVDAGQYQGNVPEGVAIGSLSGGTLAAAQGFVGGAVAQQAEQLQASTATLGEFVEAQKQLDQAAGDAPATTDTSATNAGAQLGVPGGDANQPEGQPGGEDQAADGAAQQPGGATAPEEPATT